MRSMAQAIESWEARNEQRREQAGPEAGKVYRLTGKGSVAEGKSWAEAEVRNAL